LILICRVQAKELEPLVESILSHWKPDSFSSENIVLDIGAVYRYWAQVWSWQRGHGCYFDSK